MSYPDYDDGPPRALPVRDARRAAALAAVSAGRRQPCGNSPSRRSYLSGLRGPEDRQDIMQRYRENNYAELSGEQPLPYPGLAHRHEWTEDDYCAICGADGRS